MVSSCYLFGCDSLLFAELKFVIINLCHLWHNYAKGFVVKRIDLINQIIARKKKIKITVENLAKLSGVSVRTINRLLANEDVKFSTIENVTNFLGLDFAGNEQVSLSVLKKQRAHEKALFLASIVQGTSALEMQGLEDNSLNKIIASYEKEFLSGSYQDTLWVA